MSGVVFPYQLQDGQRAYAAQLMANLQALAAQLNSVELPGLPETDLEQTLLQLKLLIDETAAAAGAGLAAVSYDHAAKQLQLQLNNGAQLQLDMSPFYNDYSGASGASARVIVDGARQISAEINSDAVSYQMLNAALRAQLDGKVAANTAGNAAQILFSDGKSMQQKLDDGELRGADGADGVHAALTGIYYFRIGEDGHLYVGVADDAAQPPFAIDASGHLIYTIE